MNTSLPIYNHKENIIKAIEKNIVTVIIAETGSGKSTQIPQYLNEAGYDVIVTEPRRIATNFLSEKVAEEIGEPIGKTVGYRTGFEKLYSEETSIMYCTDGLEVVLSLIDAEHIKDKILIVDEVHEWNHNVEVLLAYWLYKKMFKEWNIKLVLMTATIEKDDIKKYLGKEMCVIYEAPGNTFPVTFEQRSEESIIPTIIEMVQQNYNVLVFVPGKKDISDMLLELTGIEAMILPLHGELDILEQKNCLKEYPIPKVVITTNIAQTSITIPDIDVVIDTGKENRVESYNGIEGLFSRDISKSDCIQRKGRAGRTKEGRYILCSNTPYEERMEYPYPEMKEAEITQTYLRLQANGIDINELKFFHKAKNLLLEKAKKTLINLGAFDNNNNVTKIGIEMSRLPVDPQFARMIVEAKKYNVTEAIVCIASLLEVEGLLGNKGSYRNFTRETSSDLLAELDVWNRVVKADYINFELEILGIKPKAFSKAKEYYKKIYLQLQLQGETTSNNSQNRSNIKKAFLAGFIDSVYKKEDNHYIDTNGNILYLAKRSCLHNSDSLPELIVGKSRVIEQKTNGVSEYINMVYMATEVTPEEVIEMAPNLITQIDENAFYASNADIVKVTRKTFYKNLQINEEIVSVPNHPNYSELKEAYNKSKLKQIS